MWEKWYFASAVFLPQTHNTSVIMRKISENSQLRNIFESISTGLLKDIKTIKNKEILKNCHSQEEPKEKQ